jgi:hypothetical protein
MFNELISQDKEKHLVQISGQYEDGITIYKALKQAMSAQDKPRARKLEVRLDSFYTALPPASRREFCQVLCRQGLITGPLKAAIETFDASFTGKGYV